MSAEPPPVSLARASRYWLALGFTSFGGPAGQIAMMHAELVERRRWISERRFLHALNYCMVLPGPEAQQLATYLGWLMHRTAGGIIAGSLFVLPSFLILAALTWVYLRFGSAPAVTGFLYGIKPAVTAIVAFAAVRIGSRVLKNRVLWAVAAAAFIAIFALSVPFPAIVVGAGLIGLIGGRIVPGAFDTSAGHARSEAAFGPALVDDDTPTPEHARFRWSRLARVTAVFVLLWGGALGLLAWRSGWDGTLAQMGRFFTKAALVTFGGAYAVLPYVVQGAVDRYAWLTAPQMIDGLALGETTPGPLIMVVAFVGFVGGWNGAVAGSGSPDIAGLVAALVATVFTFLPSFYFIFAGGPFIESTRGDLRLSAPLNAITAAVVGVIVNLALFFTYHVLWPRGPGGPFEWASLAIAAAAFVALLRLRAGMILVILASGAAGLAWKGVQGLM